MRTVPGVPQGLVPTAIAMIAMLIAVADTGAKTRQDSAWEVVVLGIAQDGGIPQLGCERPICREIRAGKRQPEKVSSLGLINRRTGAAYVFDATPDFPAQLQRLSGGKLPAGIFLTHAHIGHYTGLMFLGRESVNAAAVPVYVTDRMGAFLRTNAPWSQLVPLLATTRLTASATSSNFSICPSAIQPFSKLSAPNRSSTYSPDAD